MIQENATQKISLRFFDLGAMVRSDSRAWIDLLARMYGRFQVNEIDLPAGRVIEFDVLTQSNNRWGKPVFITDSQVQPLSDPSLLEGYIYETILHTILAQVRDHFLIHAGVVAHQDRGIILAADTFHGKTTLALELVRRGMKFLSDEIAALGRSDKRVAPFPRSLRIRPGTLQRAGFVEPGANAPQWLGKFLLDIEAIKPNSLGKAARISHMIILRDSVEAETNLSARAMTLVLDRANEELVNVIRQMEGVKEVVVHRRAGFPAVSMKLARGGRGLSQIDAECQKRATRILDVIKPAEHVPTFQEPARLEAISTSQATMELLRRFQGGYQSALLRDEFDGSSTRLFSELASTIQAASCYQLFVGQLDQMADRVCDLVYA